MDEPVSNTDEALPISAPLGEDGATASTMTAPLPDSEAPSAAPAEVATAPTATISPEIGLSAPGAQLAGFALVALAQAAALATRRPPSASARTWALVEVYSTGHVLCMGVVAAATLAVWRRLGPRSRLAAYAALACVAIPLGQLTLRDDLTGPAQRLGEATRLMAAVGNRLLATLVSLAVPAGAALGSAAARPWLRWLAVLVAVALASANGVLESQTYDGLHLFGILVAGVLAGAALAGARLARVAARLPPRTAAFVYGLAGAVSLASVLVWPANAVVVEIGNAPSAVLVTLLARIHLRVTAARVIPPAQKEWFSDRSHLAPRPPSNPPLLSPDALVVLLGIDSVRADILANEEQRARLPELFRLRDEGVWFSMARAAGASTAPSLASLFSGLYYSQLHWTTYSKRAPELFPHSDPAPRFPELLAVAGVRTTTVDTTGWLTNEFGIVRGFGTEESARQGRGYPTAARVLGALTRRIGRPSTERVFAFAHLLDPHAPYAGAGKFDKPYDGYVAEIGLADRELGRFRKRLEDAGLWDRTTLIVFSDHGEAFGEHSTSAHSATLYDELLRVPIITRVPGLSARKVDAPVSLLDIGPTVLDLMGVATPGRMMGQSLVGLLRGEVSALSRPIVAEARLKRAMVFPDGTKLIHDTLKLGVELYDLSRDPKELTNVFDVAKGAEQSLGVVGAFFDAHTAQIPGYQVPYKKW